MRQVLMILAATMFVIVGALDTAQARDKSGVLRILKMWGRVRTNQRLWESLPQPADPFKFRMEEWPWCVRYDHGRDNGDWFSDLSWLHGQDRGNRFALYTGTIVKDLNASSVILELKSVGIDRATAT